MKKVERNQYDFNEPYSTPGVFKWLYNLWPSS